MHGLPYGCLGAVRATEVGPPGQPLFFPCRLLPYWLPVPKTADCPGVASETAEGGYLLPTMDGYELLGEFGLCWDLDSEDLRDDLAAGFSDCAWVHKDPYSVTEDRRFAGLPRAVSVGVVISLLDGPQSLDLPHAAFVDLGVRRLRAKLGE